VSDEYMRCAVILKKMAHAYPYQFLKEKLVPFLFKNGNALV
jgi:hypothetical protein